MVGGGEAVMGRATPLSQPGQDGRQTRSAPSPASGGGDAPSSRRRCASNQRALASFLILERVVGLRAQRAEHGLGSERKRAEANAAGVLDGVGDRRRYAERR